MANLPSRILFVVLVVAAIWLVANVVHVGAGDGLIAAGSLNGRAKPAAPAASAAEVAKPVDQAAKKVDAELVSSGKNAKPGGHKESRKASANDSAGAAVVAKSGASEAETTSRNVDNVPSDATRVGVKTTTDTVPASFEYLTVLAALCGALGATLHALGSLVAFVGNGKFVSSWSLWYLAQPVRGAVLASGVYWVWYGNLLDSKSVDWPKVGVGAMGLMFMVGLFSDLALEKLREVFLVLFRTGTKPRADPLDAARKPVISTARFGPVGAVAQIEISGDGFEAGDEVIVNALTQQVLTQTAKTLVVALAPALAVAGNKLTLVVRPTAKGAVDSSTATLTVP